MAFRPQLRPLDPAGASEVAGLGCAPIGNLYTPVADDDATATVRRALARGVRFFDTAPHYGAGASEVRLGRALQGIARDSVVIATKVGRRVVDADGDEVSPGAVGTGTVSDLSRDGVLRSLEGSLLRLGTDRVDLLYLHDPDDVDEALRAAIPVLHELRAEGVVRAIGVGMVHTAPLVRFAREAGLDVVMPAGRLTLLDRRAQDELLPAAREHGTGIVAAGVFNSGILADPDGAAFFDYHAASPAHRREAERMAAVCRAFGVELAHAAAAYPLRHEGVEAIVVGARTPDEVDSFCDGFDLALPTALWAELETVHTASVATP